jgi:hypothetical protein
MTWFVIVSPSTFFLIMGLQLLGGLAWVVWDEMSGERKQAYKDRIEAQSAGLPLETYIFLRKVAESQRS